jgi:hypothetical protein
VDDGLQASLLDLAGRLDAIVEELDELAFDRLREAVAEGDRARPRGDKQMMQARRSIEKASAVLRAVAEPSG